MAYLFEKKGEYRIVSYEPKGGYPDHNSREEFMKHWFTELPDLESRKSQIKLQKQYLTPQGEGYLKRKAT